MSGKRLVWALPAIGLIGSEAGHLIAYELRFGAVAQQVQTTGAHGYFPMVAKTGLGLAALGLLATIFVVGAARLAAGRRIEPDRAPSLLPLIAVLYTIQLACFAAQETVEAMAGGGHLASAPTLLLWGAVGQLPVAVMAALALRWLGARVRPALTVVTAHLPPIAQPHSYVVQLSAWPVAANEIAPRDTIAPGFNRRGPPSF